MLEGKEVSTQCGDLIAECPGVNAEFGHLVFEMVVGRMESAHGNIVVLDVLCESKMSNDYGSCDKEKKNSCFVFLGSTYVEC